jgi:uncharacterized membrane protein YdjX (TVP38/TMEM64 family)
MLHCDRAVQRLSPRHRPPADDHRGPVDFEPVDLAALLTIVRALPIDQAMAAIKGWTAGLGIWGPVVLALVYIVATVLLVPGTILTLAAGGMFGLVVGTITVSIGSTLGASLAFLIARYVARDKVAARASRNRRFGAIDRAIGEGGWKIVALLRLSPAIPFNLQNYLYGLTPIRFWPYVLTSWLAMLPGTFLYVYLGHIAGAAVGAGRSRSVAEWAMLAVGLLATVVVTVYVTRLARRKLHEQMNGAAEEEASLVPEEDTRCAPGDGARLRGTIMLAAGADGSRGRGDFRIQFAAQAVQRRAQRQRLAQELAQPLAHRPQRRGGQRMLDAVDQLRGSSAAHARRIRSASSR